MSEESKGTAEPSSASGSAANAAKPHRWTPPSGSTTEHALPLESGALSYSATADWMTLYEDDAPHAAMFYTAYTCASQAEGGGPRPVTFCFNGGPGAASAFLHIGALGPVRAVFAAGGAAPKPPVQMTDNLESWLAFTDLVFVDPIGTGFSRLLDGPDAKGGAEGKKQRDEATAKFWEVKRDLDALCEFVWRFLTRYKRWTSPLFVAGESYGGFRSACLARNLQEEYGIPLSGVYLISPAIELSSLIASDYNLIGFCDVFPSLVASAHHHGKLGEAYQSLSIDELLAEAEQCANEELPALFVQGASMAPERSAALFEKMAGLTGLSVEFVKRCQGRIRMEAFVRELLRDERMVCAVHDAALTLSDPFPSREMSEGPDPALGATWWVYTTGINALLRERLELKTHQPYQLLSMEANLAWKDSTRKHFVENSKGAMDELRFGMALNPAMKVMIVHGIHDLVTPYFSSKRLLHHMQLHPSLSEQIALKTYHGGHMFYGWDDSRAQFFADARAFYREAVGGHA